MNIFNDIYINKQIDELKVECIELTKEHKRAFNNMIENNSKENKDNYYEISKKLREKEYFAFFYTEVRFELHNNKKFNDIINEFKIRVNKETELLKNYDKMCYQEKIEKITIGKALFSKKIEVEQLKKFMDEKIYPYVYKDEV